MPCTTEEPYDCVFIKASDASKDFTRLLIETANTELYRNAGIRELWNEYEVGKSLRCIPIHQLDCAVDTVRCVAFLFFHSISWCGRTLPMPDKRKKLFYNTWLILPEFMLVLAKFR